MLDYDAEAARYDRTRGGEERAVAAAEAVLGLLPGEVRTVLDVACEPVQPAHVTEKTDAPTVFTGSGRRFGLEPEGEATYVGHGQGWSPRRARQLLPGFAWYGRLDDATARNLRSALASLPDQDRPRPDPVYRVACLRKPAS